MHRGLRDWKRQLQDIIKLNNERHASKAKCVSYKTMHERANFLFAFFKELRGNDERTYKIPPHNLGGRHIKFMIDRWVRRGLSPGTIQTYISYLRVFSSWIGKDGLVLQPTSYVQDSTLVRRTYAAQKDASWSAQGIDCAEVVARILEFDVFVGAQLSMCLAFGFRVKEAIMFQPHTAVSGEKPELAVLRGTKGGRPRTNSIDTDAKRLALELARRVAVSDTGHLGRPGHTLKQNQARFYTVLKKFGVSKKQLGITAHGLRHQFANDQYAFQTGEPSPVRGGNSIEREVDRAARLNIARELGHSREQITTSYVGAVLRRTHPTPNGCADNPVVFEPAKSLTH